MNFLHIALYSTIIGRTLITKITQCTILLITTQCEKDQNNFTKRRESLVTPNGSQCIRRSNTSNQPSASTI